MSSFFEQTFDYTSVKTNLTDRINTKNTEIAEITNELNILANLSAQYSVLGNVRTNYLTTKKICLETTVSLLGNVANEIVVVETLPSDTKNVFVDFYQTHIYDAAHEKTNQIHWMRQMVSNTTELTQDVGNLMADTGLTTDEANCVALLINKEYQPHLMTSSFTMTLHKNL